MTTPIHPSADAAVLTERVTVASVQMPSALADPAANEAAAVGLIRQAASDGAKIIVLPETAITGYLSQDLKTNWRIDGRPLVKPGYNDSIHPGEFAERADGPMIARFGALAQELQVYITVPYLEKASRPAVVSEVEEEGAAAEDEEAEAAMVDVFFNSVALVGPEGSCLGNYRKMSPWPTPECSWATKGTDPVVVDTQYGRVALAICFDIHSCLSKYARHRPWALLYPIAWVGSPSDWFRIELPGLLRDVKCPHYIIGCNWSTDEPHEEWPGSGYSTHYAPGGDLVASTGTQVGSTIVYSSIYTERAVKARREAGLMPAASLDLDKYATWTSTAGAQAREWRREWC